MDSKLISINGNDTFIFGGSFDYFRCPTELWESRLIPVRQAGFNTIVTSIPWNYHESVENRIDLRELDAFLHLCQYMGFYVIIQPGPYIGTRWNMGGFPAWLNAKGVRLRSYDPDFMTYVQRWYESVIPVIRKHQITEGGCIISALVENTNIGLPPYRKEHIKAMHRLMRRLGIEIPRIWLTPIEVPLSENKNKPNCNRINTLAKTRIKHGLGMINYSMLYEGINRMGSGENVIKTPCNSAALVQGHGGISECFYPLMLISHWLKEFGIEAARADYQPHAAQILHPHAPEFYFYKILYRWSYKKLSEMSWHESWLAASTPPEDWEPIIIGDNYEHAITGYDGYIGYHTKVAVRSDVSGKPLYLNFYGAGDNIFVFVNGALIGKRFQGNDYFSVECTESIRSGINIITVVTETVPQVHNTNHRPAGIFKPVILASAQITQHPVDICEKVNNDKVFIHLYNSSTVPQLFQFKYSDPISNNTILVPSRDYFRLKPKDMQILVGNIRLGNALLKYSTSQVLCIGGTYEQPIIVLYGETDQPGEICIALNNKPGVSGTDDWDWNSSTRMAILRYMHTDSPQTITVNDITFCIIKTDNAYKTWMVEDSHGSFPIILNNYLLKNFSYAPTRWNFQIETRAGKSTTFLLVLQKPKSVMLDGREVLFNYNSKDKILSFTYRIPSPLWKPIKFQTVKVLRELLLTKQYSKTIPLSYLEEMGDFTGGYKIYQTSFESVEEDRLEIISDVVDSNRSYPDVFNLSSPVSEHPADPKLVFLNGKFLPEISSAKAFSSADIAPYIKPGKNTLTVILECAADVGECLPGGQFERKKGIGGAFLRKGKNISKHLSTWEFQSGLTGFHEGLYLPDCPADTVDESDVKVWIKESDETDLENAVLWYRFPFMLKQTAGEIIPWKFQLEARGEGNIYLNGNFLGRYNDKAFQKDFFLPESWILNGKENVIAVVLRTPGIEYGIVSASLSPYADKVRTEHTITIEW